MEEEKQNSAQQDNIQKVNTHVVVSPEEPNEPLGIRGRLANCRGTCWTGVKENLILILLLGSVILGCMIGFIVRATTTFTKREIMYLAFPGEMLMRMLKMLILPLVICSLISGIAGLDMKTCGRMGLRTMAYFGTTTMMAVILGIILAVTIQPGGGANKDKLARYGSSQTLTAADTFLDLAR